MTLSLPVEIPGMSGMGQPKKTSSWQVDARESGGQQENTSQLNLALGTESSKGRAPRVPFIPASLV